ncbi:two-component sensor histidine kinase, partial [Micromonospora aurantiaca]|nr:two-component sensor histidine kinase [Micromonospora aurantiaca]
DEIAQLARTANATLDRLERAVGRQRQFASDASHELRSPLAGLRANLEDAAMHPEDNDLREVIRSALRDTDRLESIVTDLLLLARIGTGGTAIQEPIDLSALADTE